MSTSKKYLSIGHCCHDKAGDNFVLGGTASYSSMLAKKLGATPTVLTSFGNDFLFRSEFDKRGIPIINLEANQTTIFENKYIGDQRTQTILASASTISSSDIINLEQDFDIIHYSPIADEIDMDVISQVDEKCLTMATPQGWLRQWDASGVVSYKEIDWSLLGNVDFVIISDEDVPDLKTKLSEITEMVDTLIVTKGANGSVVYSNKVEAYFPAYPSDIIDPTGAGDTFATGFILRYAQTNEIVDSMIFANCLASICIEHPGTSFFDHLADVDERMDHYKKHLLNLNSSAPIRVK